MVQDIKLLAYNTLIEEYKGCLKEEEKELEATLVSDAIMEIQAEIKKASNVDLGIRETEKKENINKLKSRIGEYKRKLKELENSKERYVGRKND